MDKVNAAADQSRLRLRPCVNPLRHEGREIPKSKENIQNKFKCSNIAVVVELVDTQA